MTRIRLVRHILISVPDALKPLLRAYSLGYLSSIGPRLLALLIYRTLISALSLHRFPAFCGTIVGGSTLLQEPIQLLVRRFAVLAKRKGWIISRLNQIRLARFIAALFSAWVSFRLLNSKQHPASTARKACSVEMLSMVDRNKNLYGKDEAPVDLRVDTNVAISDQEVSPTTISHEPKLDQRLGTRGFPETTSISLSGRTMDLTLFALVRALDVLLGSLWTTHKRRYPHTHAHSFLSRILSQYTDAFVFASSSALIMWSWFYLPERLPPAYNTWISQAAAVDKRLIIALRRARWGEFVYGKDTGQAELLQGMCRDFNWPEEWGDPAKTIPIPCEMVHMGAGPSCEKHALLRFFKAFRFGMTMYIPLQLFVKLRHPSLKSLTRGVVDASRSSAFLGVFITLFYYSVCLSRTRLGPKLVNSKTITPQMWDSGLCVGAGCWMCGWSILVEAERRRQEIAFFVAPRAVAAVLPRRYDSKYQYREAAAFSLSAAILVTCARENPRRIRGVFGRVLNRVLNN
ncbi:MAG: hypothetical protein M1834_002987 [Cirrosporium novae-zelandiae]|nr:MAG: hypothetical protein M1834_002987 [Cirrosporium novae-zelandiae]